MNKNYSFKVGDLVYNGKYGSGVIKELYLAPVEEHTQFSREKRASILFSNSTELKHLKIEEIEKMQ